MIWPEAIGEAIRSGLATVRRPVARIAAPISSAKRVKVGREKAGASAWSYGAASDRRITAGPSSVGSRGKPVQLPMLPPRRAHEICISRAKRLLYKQFDPVNGYLRGFALDGRVAFGPEAGSRVQDDYVADDHEVEELPQGREPELLGRLARSSPAR